MIPTPLRSWRGQFLARHRPMIEAVFAGKLLAAFRRCTRPGERLWVIDWQHDWYSLDPHMAVGERLVPALPDGDSYNYVASDFRFGLVMGWRDTGPVTLFGADLLAAFAADPPAEFLRVCGPGESTTAVPSSV
ncbi:MAG TPA: DUF2716 domain-containing protein [Urbifossiella sp.]|nr:DUF2716 domain-containing protein [Urbifossiella sp.]